MPYTVGSGCCGCSAGCCPSVVGWTVTLAGFDALFSSACICRNNAINAGPLDGTYSVTDYGAYGTGCSPSLTIDRTAAGTFPFTSHSLQLLTSIDYDTTVFPAQLRWTWSLRTFGPGGSGCVVLDSGSPASGFGTSTAARSCCDPFTMFVNPDAIIPPDGGTCPNTLATITFTPVCGFSATAEGEGYAAMAAAGDPLAPAPATPATAAEPPAPCRHRGADIGAGAAAAVGLNPAKRWALCLAPGFERFGQLRCPCDGCGPSCPRYESELDSPAA